MKEDILMLIPSGVSMEMFKELDPQLEILLWKSGGFWPPGILKLHPVMLPLGSLHSTLSVQT